MNLQQRLALARVGLVGLAARLRHGQPELLRQQPDGLHEADPFVQLDELDDVAAHAAAEAVEEPLLAVDVERRRLLAVERAQALVRAPGLLQGHVFLDHLDDVRAGPQVLDEGLGEQRHLVLQLHHGHAAAALFVRRGLTSRDQRMPVQIVADGPPQLAGAVPVDQPERAGCPPAALRPGTVRRVPAPRRPCSRSRSGRSPVLPATGRARSH